MTKTMTNITLVAFAWFCAAVLGACTTATTEKGFSDAKAGKTQITYTGFAASKDELKKAIAFGFSERQWVVESQTDTTVTASIKHNDAYAKAVATVSENKVVFETKGSTLDGKPHVPINYVENVVKSARKVIKTAKSIK